MRVIAKVGALLAALMLAAFGFRIGALAASIEPTHPDALWRVFRIVLFSQFIGIGYWILVFCPKRGHKLNNGVRLSGAVGLIMPLIMYGHLSVVTNAANVRTACLFGISLTAWLVWEAYRGSVYSAGAA
jgi:hypothetical protein